MEVEVGEPVLVGDLEQPFTVTAFDANHCAGKQSIMALEIPSYAINYECLD